jgi:hypothetical protein
MIKQGLAVVDVGRSTENSTRLQASDAAGRLAAYLDFWRSRGSSKHTLMGPVATIIDTLRREDASSGDLLGRAIRQHELAQQRRMEPEALAELEEGVGRVLNLVSPLKPAERLRLLTSIEWEVFYLRRRRQQERTARLRAAWHEFVRNRHGDDIQMVQRAWKRPDIATWEKLPHPWESRSATTGSLGEDARSFLSAYRSPRGTLVLEEGEGDEEP